MDLSSPKRTASLLFIKHRHGDKTSLKYFQLLENLYVGRKYKCCPHMNTNQCLVMIYEDRVHMKEKKQSKKLRVVNSSLMFQPYKKHFLCTPDFFCLRDKTYILIKDAQKSDLMV